MASMCPCRPTAPILGSASFSRCLTSVIRMSKSPACLTLDWPRAAGKPGSEGVLGDVDPDDCSVPCTLQADTRIHKVFNRSFTTCCTLLTP